MGVAIKENLEVLQWAEVLAQESLGKFEMTHLNLRLFLFLQPGDVMGGGLKPAATNRRKWLIFSLSLDPGSSDEHWVTKGALLKDYTASPTQTGCFCISTRMELNPASAPPSFLLVALIFLFSPQTVTPQLNLPFKKKVSGAAGEKHWLTRKWKQSSVLFCPFLSFRQWLNFPVACTKPVPTGASL